MVEAVRLGTQDGGLTSTGPVGNFVPEIKILDIPFPLRDYAHARATLDGPIGQDLLTEFPTKGLVALAWSENGFRHMTNNKRPIVQAADAAGLKLRTMENKVHMEGYKTFGLHLGRRGQGRRPDADACLGMLEPQRLARIAADGRQLTGDHASKTLAPHRRIYEADPQARCVIHTHSTPLVALTPDGACGAEDPLPPITPYFVMKVGHVPLIGYRRPGAPEAADAASDAIGAAAARGAPIRAVMLERLGPVAWHATPAEASAVLDEPGETARLWWMSGRRCAPLDEARIDELRRTFGARW